MAQGAALAPHVDAVGSWPGCHQEPPDLPRALSKPPSTRRHLTLHAGGAACSWRSGGCRGTRAHAEHSSCWLGHLRRSPKGHLQRRHQGLAVRSGWDEGVLMCQSAAWEKIKAWPRYGVALRSDGSEPCPSAGDPEAHNSLPRAIPQAHPLPRTHSTELGRTSFKKLHHSRTNRYKRSVQAGPCSSQYAQVATASSRVPAPWVPTR